MKRTWIPFALCALLLAPACAKEKPGEVSLFIEVVGEGSVAAEPGTKACDESCILTYREGTDVTLTATSDDPRFVSFTRWTQSCSGTDPCVLDLAGDRYVRAEFERAPTETLTVSVVGAGTVTSNPTGIACPPTCTSAFVLGENVTLSSTATAPATHRGWYGGCYGTGLATCDLQINVEQNLTAVFSESAEVWSGLFMGGAANESSLHAATDSLGNTVIAGTSQGTHSLGGDTLLGGLFVAHFEADGSHNWSRTIGTSAGATPTGIVIDSAGSLIVTGGFTTPGVDFGGGPLANNGSSGNDIFLLKLSAAGEYVWAQAFSADGQDFPMNVDVDANDNIVISGACNHADLIDFGGGGLACAPAAYVAKFSSDGTPVWSKTFANGALAQIAVDRSDGSVILGTSGSPTMDFGGGAIAGAAFVAKLSQGGGYLWANAIANGSVRGVDVNANGTIAATGGFTGTINWGGVNLTAVGNSDLHMAVFDSAGNHIWSDSYGAATETAFGTRIALDDDADQVVMMGGFNGVVDFGTGAMTGGVVGSSAIDIVLARYDAMGTPIWSQRIGGPPIETGNSIDIDQNGSCIVAGSYSGIADFGSSSQLSAGAEDVFLLRLAN